MKFGRCRERRSKSPMPRKGHRSAKLPSQEPLQTSASRSTSSTPGETPQLNSTASHHSQTHPASAVGAALAPGTMGQEGLPEAIGDGWWLAETSEQGPDVTSRTSHPVGALAGDQEVLHCQWSSRRLRQSPAHPPLSLKDFAHGWAKSLPSFPADKAGDGDGDGAELVVGRHHLGTSRWDPSIAYCRLRASSVCFQASQRLSSIQ